MTAGGTMLWQQIVVKQKSVQKKAHTEFKKNQQLSDQTDLKVKKCVSL